MLQIQIIKTGTIVSDGSGDSTPTTKARNRVDSYYNYSHSDYTIGFTEIDKTAAKFGDTTIEANQFYEI